MRKPKEKSRASWWVEDQLKAAILIDLRPIIPEGYFELESNKLQLDASLDKTGHLSKELSWGTAAGRLGHNTYFKNTAIIMTSNSGMSGVDGDKYANMLAKIEAHDAAVAAGKPVDPSAKPLPTVEEVNRLWDEEIDLMVGAALKERFRPEFLNRIDEIIVFNPLSKELLKKIVGIQLDRMKKYIREKGIDIVLTDAAKEMFAETGYDPVYGARPLKRALQREILNPLAIKLLDGTFREGDVVEVDYKENRLEFSRLAEAEVVN